MWPPNFSALQWLNNLRLTAWLTFRRPKSTRCDTGTDVEGHLDNCCEVARRLDRRTSASPLIADMERTFRRVREGPQAVMVPFAKCRSRWLVSPRTRDAHVPMIYRFKGVRLSCIRRVTSRAHSMNRSTTGLRVRFLNVMIVTRNDHVGTSTGSIFNRRPSLSCCSIDFGTIVMNRPRLANFARRCSE